MSIADLPKQYDPQDAQRRWYDFWLEKGYFHADPASLTRFSVTGPSRAVPVIRPGEEQDLFGDAFTIEELSRGDRTACFLLTRV